MEESKRIGRAREELSTIPFPHAHSPLALRASGSSTRSSFLASATWVNALSHAKCVRSYRPFPHAHCSLARRLVLHVKPIMLGQVTCCHISEQ